LFTSFWFQPSDSKQMQWRMGPTSLTWIYLKQLLQRESLFTRQTQQQQQQQHHHQKTNDKH
jgi:hypothetical protein